MVRRALTEREGVRENERGWEREKERGWEKEFFTEFTHISLQNPNFQYWFWNWQMKPMHTIMAVFICKSLCCYIKHVIYLEIKIILGFKNTSDQ